MFEGNGIEQIEIYAAQNKIHLHQAALTLKSDLIQKAAVWPEPKTLSEVKKIDAAKLCESQRNDLLTELSKQIAGYLQFPSSTIWLHGLGCVASALSKSFVIDYHGFSEIPVNLYVITSQPPSTGKSEVNRRFFTPIMKSYKALNDIHKIERERLEREIKRLTSSLESGKSKNEYDEQELIDQIDQKTDRLLKIPEWKPMTTNATPEALENLLSKNNGLFGIVSAEAEAISVVTGSVYKGDSKSNFELLLKSWDGEWYNSQRITRNGFDGYVVGSIAVIAQDDTIDTMLRAAAEGRGLTERFLLLSEQSQLGKRDHFKKFSFNKSIYERYEQLIRNIIMEEKVSLNFDATAEEQLRAHKQRLEPLMADDGAYSHSLLTGFIGKADKQIRKIAAVLHCIDNWQDGGNRSRTISDDYVLWASSIFDELSKTFVSAADFMGYVGSDSEAQKLSQILSEYAQKGKTKIAFTQLRQRVRGLQPFRGSRNIADKLKNEVLPKLEALNHCICDNDTIYINPRLK